MTPKQLARIAIRLIETEYFEVKASVPGNTDPYWEDDTEQLEVRQCEMRYLVRERLKKDGQMTKIVDIDDLFDCVAICELDLQAKLNIIANEVVYPGSTPENDTLSKLLTEFMDDNNIRPDDAENAPAPPDEYSDCPRDAVGKCVDLERCIEAWAQFITAIITGKAHDDNFEDCLDYFDNLEYEEEEDHDFNEWFAEFIQ